MTDHPEPSPTSGQHPTVGFSRARVPGGILLLLGGLLAMVLLTSNDRQLLHGPLWGAMALCVALVGLLSATGLVRWRPRHQGLEHQNTLSPNTPLQATGSWWTRPGVLGVGAVLVVLLMTPVVGMQALPWVLFAALLLLFPAVLSRPGLFVTWVTALIYLPTLGAYGLWDPWETHYGEVAREILGRDDWISLWWAQDGWFWSKPILIFWIEALTVGALGLPFQPDVFPEHIEWAVRLPIVLLSMGATAATYQALRDAFSTRAGVYGALAVATAPHFLLLGHQAITDMPFVACMTIAICAWIRSMVRPAGEQDELRTWGPLQINRRAGVVALLFAVVAPQAVYWISRNLLWTRPFRLAFRWDTYLMGSAGNHGVPGNAAHQQVQSVFHSMAAQPAFQGLLLGVALAGLLWVVIRQTQVRALFMYVFYIFCGLAFLGKGIPGFALPGLIALLFLVGTGRWSMLLSGQLKVGTGIGLLCTVGLPWYVAMYTRHGVGFTDRLFVHDHINRLASGVHGDKGDVQYLVEQLGFGMFPWIGLLPAGLMLWRAWLPPQGGTSSVADSTPTDPTRAVPPTDILKLITIWCLAAFVLFSAMITKFHHYIFPMVPAGAMLCGLLLERFHTKAIGPRELVAIMVGVGLCVLGMALGWGDIRGVVPAGVLGDDWVLQQASPLWVSLGTFGLGVAALVYAARSSTGSVPAPLEGSNTGTSAMGAQQLIAMVAATGLLAFVGRDLSWATDARPHGFERFIQLFIYKYERPWPPHLDYRPILTGFAVVAGLITCAGWWSRVRPLVAPAFLSLAILISGWIMYVYIPDVSPHWSQKELVSRYYQLRQDPTEPLVAYQMNWKGENFYTGNHVAAFATLDNTRIKNWMEVHTGSRVFFVLEHHRLSGLRQLLGKRFVREVTTKRDNNHFLLVEAKL